MTKSPERLTARQRAAVHRVASELAADHRGGGWVVFSGASGTGTTLAADLLAHQLARPLFRVDLGLLVSKYIGETEKNLSRLFAGAEQHDAILFFDEADSLLGRRTGTEDAHDRSANTETAHLLARVERHPGVVILATNGTDELDPAVVRRARMVIDLDGEEPG